MPSLDEIAATITGALAALGASGAGVASETPSAVPQTPLGAGTLTVEECWTIFRAQVTSRQLDLAARRMQAAGRVYYTISSAGHESNAIVAAALRPTDPALLHYRSGGFYVRRAWQHVGIDPIADVLAGVAAASDEPIAGGRHKVFGRREIAIIPQTSTIASHLPRAVGVAFAIERARKLGIASAWPGDAITVVSAGDASLNHSTATGAINAALWCRYSGLPMPLLIVCEDNGIGISVHTPTGWIAAAYGNRPALAYFSADGTDPAAVFDAATAAVDHVRRLRSPAFLHLATVRLYGHAGSDAEVGYRSAGEIAADVDRDPILGTARALMAAGAATAGELANAFTTIGEQVSAAIPAAMAAAPLRSREEVMAPLAPRHPQAVAAQVRSAPAADDVGTPLTLAQSINHTLHDELAHRPEMLLFGEDIGRKGGVYGVTRGLQHVAGRGRVFDTLLDEQTILGLALGTALTGFLPVPEIQYLAYLHNAEDQLRGEGASLQFFSNGQYRNPMVVRIAGYGYQKGFGGHFHNDNSVAVLRDIPGVVIASPSRGDDAAAMLRTCLAAAWVDGTVCVFLEPIALYHTRDLYTEGDNAWLTPYPEPSEHIPIGSARTYGDGGDLTILTFGNGVPLSLRAAKRLAQRSIACRVVDLRWLSPLPIEDILREAAATGRVLVVDETRRSGGVGEGIVTAVVEHGFTGSVALVASADSFVPLGPAANLVLVSEDDIVAAAAR
ncbi:MAG: thiamine pyrophosphate-dependent enzyme [Gemmatimonadaceae bacterium]